MSIEKIFNSSLNGFDKISFFRNVSEYIVWKRNMQNRLKALNLFDYIEEDEFLDLSVRNKKIWRNGNRRIRVILRMRFGLNAQKIVEIKLLVKEIWDILAVEYKSKGSDHVNLVYEALNNCKLSFFFIVDDYCDKFIELVFKAEAFVFIEDVQLSEVWLIYRFHMNLDFNYQQYCENYLQTHDVFDETNQVKFILFYVIKRLVNVAVVFNSNISVFVIAFHVCTSFGCSHSHSAYAVAGTLNDSIVQNGVVSDLDSKIIIKIIFHCTHCGKNYHDKNHCEILHLELKEKRLVERRNRSGNGNRNNRNNRNRNNNDNGNSNGNDDNSNNDNRVARRINNNSNIVKELDFLKAFIVANSDFLEKGVNMTIVEESEDVVNMTVEDIFFEIAWIWDIDVTSHFCKKRFVFEIYFKIISIKIRDFEGNIYAIGKGNVRFRCVEIVNLLASFIIEAFHVSNVFVNLLFNAKFEEVEIHCQLFPDDVKIDSFGIIVTRSKVAEKLYAVNLWKLVFEKALSAAQSIQFIIDDLNLFDNERISDEVFFKRRKYNEKIITAWHRRFGHLKRVNLIRTLEDFDVDLIKPLKVEDFCDVCEITSVKRRSHKSRITFDRHRNDLIYSDIVGSFVDSCSADAKYFITFMNDLIKKFFVYIIAAKSQVFVCFKAFKVHVERDDERIHRLRTDWEREYFDYEFETYRHENDIEWEFCISEKSQVNEVVERLDQLLWIKISALLVDVVFSLNKKYWSETVKTVNYLRNRQYNFNLDCSLYEKDFGRKLKLTHFRKIEDMKLVNIHLGAAGWKKRKSRKIYCRLLGYENDNIYRLLVFDDFIYRFDKVSWLTSGIKRKADQSLRESLFEQVRREVKQKISLQVNKISILFALKTVRFKKFSIQFISDESRIVEVNFDDESVLFFFVLSRSSFAIEISTFSSKIIDHFILEFFRFFRFFFSLQSRLDQIMTRHSELQQRDLFFDFFGYVALMVDVVNYFKARESKTYKKVMRDFMYKMEWQLAVNEEIDFFFHNGTWVLVDRSFGQKVLTAKWVFKLKKSFNNEIIRHKTRWVVRGFEQREGLDFDETFVSMVKSMSYKTIFAFVVVLNWELKQMNVKIVFLYDDIDFDVYLYSLEKYDVKDKICKFRKALYDLKQFSRLWFKTFVKFVAILNYKTINVDESVFINYEIKIIIAFYVNDILLVGVSRDVIVELKIHLSNKFHMIDMGFCNYYLGLKVIRDRVNRIIRLSQHDYIRFVLDRFQMSEFKKNDIFMNSNLHLKFVFDDYETSVELREWY